MQLIKTGATRWVLLTKSYAFKVPNLTKYRTFLCGLLANMQEVAFSKVTIFKHKLCPVLFHLPGGLLVVMPRCGKLKKQYTNYELENFCNLEEGVIPAEIKQDSFGMLNDNLVCLDYGSVH